MTEKIEALQEQIKKTEKILAESRDNYEKNPESYSARLLLLSTENYLGDLLRELDVEMLRHNVGKAQDISD